MIVFAVLVFSSLPLLPVLAWFARITMLTICATWGFDCKSSGLKINGPGAANLPRQAFFMLLDYFFSVGRR